MLTFHDLYSTCGLKHNVYQSLIGSFYAKSTQFTTRPPPICIKIAKILDTMDVRIHMNSECSKHNSFQNSDGPKFPKFGNFEQELLPYNVK
jgi:hypothetical protein